MDGVMLLPPYKIKTYIGKAGQERLPAEASFLQHTSALVKLRKVNKEVETNPL